MQNHRFTMKILAVIFLVLGVWVEGWGVTSMASSGASVRQVAVYSEMLPALMGIFIGSVVLSGLSLALSYSKVWRLLRLPLPLKQWGPHPFALVMTGLRCLSWACGFYSILGFLLIKGLKPQLLQTISGNPRGAWLTDLPVPLDTLLSSIILAWIAAILAYLWAWQLAETSFSPIPSERNHLRRAADFGDSGGVWWLSRTAGGMGISTRQDCDHNCCRQPAAGSLLPDAYSPSA